MTHIDKKLRETHFFLEKLAERARFLFGDPEEVDFYLSAFHSAGRSVDYRLRHRLEVEFGETEGRQRYKTFYQKWEDDLSLEDRLLLKFMMADRALEVHEDGSQREQLNVSIARFGSYEYGDESGTLISSAPPGAPSEIFKRTYFFLINGERQPMIETCHKYASLLDRLVNTYRKHGFFREP